MPTTLPVPISFRLPEGWLPASPPEGPDAPGVAFAAGETVWVAGLTAHITNDGV
ncbi:hypothetical protein ACFXPJ_41860 [Streptomyces goshikiensis]